MFSIKGTNIREGLGLQLWHSGDSYEGQFKNDRLHGYGEYYWNKKEVHGDHYQG